MNQRRLRVFFLSISATIVSVGIWIIAIVLNLIWTFWGKSQGAVMLGWAVTIISTIFFFLIFYRHFSKTEA